MGRARARFVSGKGAHGARVGARCASVRGACVRFVWHARTLARVPTVLARVPAWPVGHRLRVRC